MLTKHCGCHQSEEELVSLLRARTKIGFDILYQGYASALYYKIKYHVTNKNVAEDLLQETFLKIWNNIELYNEDKGRLFTWFSAIARNTCIDYHKSNNCERKQLKLMGEPDFLNEYLTNLEISLNTDVLGLENLVSKLEPKYYTVVNIVFFKGFSHQEAAKELNLSLGTLKTRIRTALHLLRTELTYSNVSV